MPKQSFGPLNIDMKDYIKLQKEKDIYETRKTLLKKNLKKRKSKKNLIRWQFFLTGGLKRCPDQMVWLSLL